MTNNRMNIRAEPLQQIFRKLPGQRKHFIKTISYEPMQYCLDKFAEVPDDADTVILCMLDIWPLWNSDVLNHPKLVNKKFFLVDLGYENKKIGPQQWHISSYYCYFLRQKTQYQIKDSGLNHGYSCLNNRVDFARLVLGWNLWKNHLLEHVIFSQNDQGAWWLENGSAPMVASQLHDFDEYCKLLPIRAQPDIDPRDFGGDWSTDHPAYQQTYCNIVTETHIGGDIYGPDNIATLQILSEKSHKPFASCQVPIYLACPGHVQCLRKLGFETMEQDLFGPDYDFMHAHDKIAAVVEVVKKGPEFIENFYFDHLREIKHNHELLVSDKVDTLIMENVDLFLQQQGLVQ